MMETVTVIMGLVIAVSMFWCTLALIRAIDSLSTDIRLKLWSIEKAIDRQTKAIENKKCECKTKVVHVGSRKRRRI